MLNQPDPNGDTRQALSSLMDSECDPAALPPVVGAWQQDADSRATWHCYHLIGDVMRSDELARPAGRDAAMLQALRLRLADEPVPLAPRALDEAAVIALPASALAGGRQSQPAGGRLHRLRVPAAAAAVGFVVVAGVMVLLRQQAPSAADGAQLARVQPQAQPGVATPAGTLVRDAGLDRYLEAHRRMGSSVAAAGAAEHRVHIVHEPK